MSNTNLEVEVKALRLIMERLLTLIPDDVLDRAVERERSNLAHLEAAGETIPSSNHSDLEAVREALKYYEDAASRRAEFGPGADV